MFEKIFPILFSTVLSVWNPTPQSYGIYAAPATDVPVSVVQANQDNFFVLQEDTFPGDQVGQVFTMQAPANVIGQVNLYGAQLTGEHPAQNWLVPLTRGVSEDTWIIVANPWSVPVILRIRFVNAAGGKYEFHVQLPTGSRVLRLDQFEIPGRNFDGVATIQANYGIGVWGAVCYPGECYGIPTNNFASVIQSKIVTRTGDSVLS